MMTQPRINRFDFFSLRDFRLPHEVATDSNLAEQEGEKAALAAPTLPPLFSLQELEAEKARAEQAAYQRGLSEGIEKARSGDAEREAALIALLKQCDAALAQIRQEYQRHVQQKQAELTRLAYEIARHVAGEALRAVPEATVEKLVAECLPLLLDEPRIIVTLHPSLAGFMQEKLDRMAQSVRYEGKFIIEKDERLEPADCKVAWQEGEAQLSLQEVWREIRQRLGIAQDAPAQNVPAVPAGPVAGDEAGDTQSQIPE